MEALQLFGRHQYPVLTIRGKRSRSIFGRLHSGDHLASRARVAHRGEYSREGEI